MPMQDPLDPKKHRRDLLLMALGLELSEGPLSLPSSKDLPREQREQGTAALIKRLARSKSQSRSQSQSQSERGDGAEPLKPVHAPQALQDAPKRRRRAPKK